MIEEEWMEIEKDSFKLKAKINIIQKGLEFWKTMKSVAADFSLFAS